jgi:hypothetical protein
MSGQILVDRLADFEKLSNVVSQWIGCSAADQKALKRLFRGLLGMIKRLSRKGWCIPECKLREPNIARSQPKPLTRFL